MGDDCSSNIEVTGPGGIGAKLNGKRMAETITLVLVLVVLGISYMSYMAMQQVSSAITGLSQAQRELTCIISRPQEEREREYLSGNSFCKQMGRMP